MKGRVVEFMKPILSALAIVLLGQLAPAFAQDSRTYAGATGFLFAGSQRQASAPSLPTTGAGGTAIGVGFETGTFLTPRVALGAEVSLPGRFTSIQETDYSRVFQQKSHHRDVALSGVVRTMLGSSPRLRVGFVAGGGVVRESTSSSNAISRVCCRRILQCSVLTRMTTRLRGGRWVPSRGPMSRWLSPPTLRLCRRSVRTSFGAAAIPQNRGGRSASMRSSSVQRFRYDSEPGNRHRAEAQPNVESISLRRTRFL